MRTNTQTIKPKHLAMLAVLLATLLATLLLAACVAPAAMPAATPTTAPGPEPAAGDIAPAGEPVTVALPQTQPLPSLVMLDAGSITVTAAITSTEAITGDAQPAAVVIPVQGAFTLPVWRANGHHQHPLAVILPDAYRVCEANEAEEWPCPPGLQRNDYLGLRPMAQALALHGYFPLIVDLNGAYSPAAGPVPTEERAVQIVDHLLAWMADDIRQPGATTYGGEMAQSADYGQILLVGHGQGAAMALAVAEARVDRTSDEEIAAGLGPVAGLLLVAPELPADAKPVDVPTAVVVAGCDPGAEEVLAMVEAGQASAERQSLLASVLLPGATRDGSNPLAADGEAGCDGGAELMPEEQQTWLGQYAPAFANVVTGYAPASAEPGLDALVPPPTVLYGLPAEVAVADPSRPGQPGEIQIFNPVVPFPSYNPNSVFCQDRGQYLAAEAARAFVAQLAPDFLDVAFGRLPAAAIPGFEPSQPLTTTLYGAAVEITALPGPGQRLPLLIPRDDVEMTTNLVGGVVEAEGMLQVSICEGTGERMCVVDRSITLRPEATPEDWVYAQPKFAGYPPQLRVQWDKPGAMLRLTIPEAAGDFSGYDMLHLRTLVDMFDERNDGVDAQSFSVALVDRAGNRAAVVLPPGEPALIKDRGERIEPYYWSYYPLRARSVRLPLADFGGVDLEQVAAVELVFDQVPAGSMLVSDVEMVQRPD